MLEWEYVGNLRLIVCDLFNILIIRLLWLDYNFLTLLFLVFLFFSLYLCDREGNNDPHPSLSLHE